VLISANMESKRTSVGIFDSGVGGLTVYKAIKERMPFLRIVYFGDTARVPYGTKSKETITRFSIENTEFLLTQNIDLIVVACNTASSVAIEVLKEKFSIPIFGVVNPLAETAYLKTKNKNIGVIGTNATIASKAYEKALKGFDRSLNIYSKACPLLVPLVEEGWLQGEVPELVVKHYLWELKEKNIDTLILGCTHYPLLKPVIGKIMGENVILVDSGFSCACVLERFLKVNSGEGKIYGEDVFFVSDMPDKFEKVGELFLNKKISNIKKVVMEEESWKLKEDVMVEN